MSSTTDLPPGPTADLAAPAPAPTSSRLGRGRAAVAGLLGVAAALATAEFLGGLFAGVPSLVDAVGTLVVDNVTPGLKTLAIELFGTADKIALGIGTVIIALAIGVAVGIRAARDFTTAVVAFVAFGLLGVLMAIQQPLATPLLVVVTTAAAIAIGLVVLRRLLAVGTVTGSAPGDSGRRQFLGTAGVAGLSIAATGVVGRSLGGGERPDLDAIDLPDVSPAQSAPPPTPAQVADQVDGISPLVTPLDEFYRIDTALAIPNIAPEQWSLRIHGLVDREVTFTYDDILAMDLFEKYITISCVSNEVGGDLIGNARWQGVRLSDLLERAGVQEGAGQVVGRSIDGWTAGFPTELAFDGRDAMLAIAMNGEPLPQRHGFPARLIVPGIYGYVSATKWITEIELTTWDGFDAYWVPRGWSKLGPIKTQSRIDTPRNGRQVPAGPTVVAGVAWAMPRKVQMVEVQVNGGDWQECQLTEPISGDVWIQWWTEVDLAPGNALLTVRATDDEGVTQTSQPSRVDPDGATGHHSIRVNAEAV